MATYPGEISFALFDGSPSSAVKLGGQTNPLLGGFAEGSNALPTSARRVCPRPWGVTEVKLRYRANASTSFDDRGHEPIKAGREAAGRFYFLPLTDQVSVSWRLRNPADAETMVMELLAAGSEAPIWSRTLAAEPARKEAFDEDWDGSFPAGEWIDRANFPDHVVTAAGSPYMLRVRAEGANVEPGYEERFTYFDVLVDRLELQWGGADLIPAAERDDIEASLRAKSVAEERALVTQLATRPLDADRLEVVLPGNRFMNASAQMKGDYLFASHREQWGDGPRIPLLADIFLARAGGGSKHLRTSAKVLGKLEFLWDWESEDETALLDRYPNATMRAFIGAAVDYNRNDGSGPPGSTNCHVDRGGKRGGGAVFPAQGRGDFRYRVTASVGRPWAALSQAKLRRGKGQGRTGVVFQPSRMARDTYRVTVTLAKINGQSVLEVADRSGEQLRQQFPDLPRASTGTFEMMRSIAARYIRKAPGVEAVNTATASREHALAGLRLAWSATEDAAFQAAYAGHVQRIFNKQLRNRNGVVNAATHGATTGWFDDYGDALAGLNQAADQTTAAFTVWDYTEFKKRLTIKATRDYVLNKARKINTPRNLYDAWRQTAGPAADDSTYLWNYYQSLSNKKRAKIDPVVTAKLQVLSVDTEEKYADKMTLVGAHGFKVACQQYMIETRGDDNQSFITFHVVDPIRFQKGDGSHQVVASNIGGLAPSFETLTDRRHAMLLIYIPQTVRDGVAAEYTVSATPVVAHEAGHTFFLCHAPADHDKPNVRIAGGYSADHHDAADLLCLMNYDFDSDHLCGLCNLKLRGWSLDALSNQAADNRSP